MPNSTLLDTTFMMISYFWLIKYNDIGGISMKKKICLTTIMLVMMTTVCACSDNQEAIKRKTNTTEVVTGGAVEKQISMSVFGEDADADIPFDVEKLYREKLKKGKNYTLYISNYPEINSKSETDGTINIGNEELYYTISDAAESTITYHEDEAKKQTNTNKYKVGWYRIYNRVGNRFYSLWIDETLDEKTIKKMAKEIFDKYCTL